MNTQTFIAPDGKLYTHKKFVNWEGVREVEGCEEVRPTSNLNQTAEGSITTKTEGHIIRIDIKLCDFIIQD